jgi:hypothetical protein
MSVRTKKVVLSTPVPVELDRHIRVLAAATRAKLCDVVEAALVSYIDAHRAEFTSLGSTAAALPDA